MPIHIKCLVSAVTLIVGVGYWHFESNYGESELAMIGLGLSLFMVVAMWIFPETGKKK